MKVFKINLWDFIGKVDALCITTNGFIKRGGKAVMGRGCAFEASKKFIGIDEILGYKIEHEGNVPHILWENPLIVSFPVKPESKICIDVKQDVVKHMVSKFKVGDFIPGWACKANLDIIENSAKLLSLMANSANWKRVVLPTVGTGYGEMGWEIIEPILDQYLDDRFFCVSF